MTGKLRTRDEEILRSRFFNSFSFGHGEKFHSPSSYFFDSSTVQLDVASVDVASVDVASVDVASVDVSSDDVSSDDVS